MENPKEIKHSRSSHVENTSWLKPGQVIHIENEKDFVIKDVVSAVSAGEKLGLKIKRNIPIYYLDGISNRQAAYHPETDVVLMFNNSHEVSLKHELIHVVENSQEKTASLVAFYERVKQTITESSFTGGFFTFNFNKNISEFIADGYSKEPFIEALKKEGLYEEFLRETAYLFE